MRCLLRQEGKAGDANAGYAVVAAQSANPVHPTADPTRPRDGHPDAACAATRIVTVELSGVEPLAFGLPNRRSPC